MLKFPSLCLASALMLAPLAVPLTGARAATFTVTTTFGGPGSLPAAVSAANNAAGADTIVFALGASGTINLNAPLILRDEVTIVGPGTTRLTVSGNNQVPIFRVNNNATARISGLQLSGGRATSTTSMTADGASGGAIFVDNGATLIADRLFLTGNTAFGGGAIENFGTLQIDNSTLSSNSATAGTGGAIHSTPNSRALTIRNCTFANNNAGDSGGAIRADISNTTLDSLTVVRNSAGPGFNGAGAGGGISVGPGAGVTLRNSIVIENTRGNTDGNLSIDAANIVTGNAQGAGLQTSNGQPALNQTGFGPPTIGLVNGSRAIDAGNTALTTDQRGTRRPIDIPQATNVNNASDIGAVEFDDNQLGNPRPDGSNFQVNTLDDHDDGVCGTGDCSLREAINVAGTNGRGSVIGFAPGLQGVLALRTFLPEINKNLTVRGPGAGVVTIDGSGSAPSDKVLNVLSGTVAISGLTVRGGRANGAPILDNGGGLFNGGTLTLTAMAFVSNTADNNGGAILNLGTLTINACTFSGNSATRNGGAIENRGGTLLISNSTISGNSASGVGGALFNSGGGGVTIRNSTIAGNVSTQNNGSGIVNSGSAVRVSNSIIAGNGSGNVDVVGNAFNSQGYNLIGGGSAATQFTATGDQIGVTAAQLSLGALGDNGGPTQTRALNAGSIAINAGDPAFVGTGQFDQRGTGFDRVQGGRLDIGAFESAFAPNSAPVIDPTINSPSVPGPNDLVITDPRGSDADGDALTYTFVFAINGTTIAGEPGFPNRVDLSKYTVAVGDTFTATFTANDGIVDSTPVTLTRTIAAPPVANPASGSADAGVRTPIGPISGTDPNGLELRYVLLTQPTSGNAFLAGDADNVQLFYTSARGFSGADSVTYQVVNSEGRRSAPATIDITVVGNSAPTASDGSATVKAGVRTEVPLSASDADGDSLRYRIATEPSNGSAFLANNQSGGVSLFYTANRNFSGPDSVAFRVTDPSGASAIGTISLTVQGNSAPTANAASLNATTGQRASVVLSGSDADGDALVRYRITSQPSNGTAFLAGSGDNVRLYYTSDAGYTGADSVAFTVTDSGGRASAPATVSVQVGSPNPAPISAPAPSASVS